MKEGGKEVEKVKTGKARKGRRERAKYHRRKREKGRKGACEGNGRGKSKNVEECRRLADLSSGMGDGTRSPR